MLVVRRKDDWKRAEGTSKSDYGVGEEDCDGVVTADCDFDLFGLRSYSIDHGALTYAIFPTKYRFRIRGWGEW